MAIENYKTFQDILDGILIKTLETDQNFPEEDRIVGINEEYLFLRQLVDRYNVGREFTVTVSDSNYYDQTLTAGNNQLTNSKDGVIRKIEYKIDGESTWHKLKRTSVAAYEGDLSDDLDTVTTPDYFIERNGNITLIGTLNTDATVRIWIGDDLVLLSATNKTDEPRLPLFARVLLVLSPTIEYMERHNMHGVDKYKERYALVLNEFRRWAKQASPNRQMRVKSVRRR